MRKKSSEIILANSHSFIISYQEDSATKYNYNFITRKRFFMCVQYSFVQLGSVIRVLTLNTNHTISFTAGSNKFILKNLQI